MLRRAAVLALAALLGCGGGEDDTDPSNPTDTSVEVDLSGCASGDAPEVFFGKGVGGAFEPMAPGDQATLIAAPQGGFGVSLLVGTRGLQAGPEERVTAELVTVSEVLETAGSTFQLNATLACKADGGDPAFGVIYGVVVGFSSSLSNTDLLALNGTEVVLTVSVTDANGVAATGSIPVTLVVGE